MGEIHQNLQKIEEVLKPYKNVILIAVSKTKPLSLIEEAIISGQYVFGENKIGEGIEKFSTLKNRESLSLHHLGPVQSGTCKKLFGNFDFTHGVGSISSLENLMKESLKHKKILKYFLQANLTDEDSKNGFNRDDLSKVLINLANFQTDTLQFEGLMTMGPTNEDAILTRKVFRELFSIKESLSPNAKLSMGMSGDFKIALEEKTDYIRIGSMIFGNR